MIFLAFWQVIGTISIELHSMLCSRLEDLLPVNTCIGHSFKHRGVIKMDQSLPFLDDNASASVDPSIPY
jgi:hypothetical protein